MNQDLTEDQKAQLKTELDSLKTQLTGDIFEDGDVMDQILDIELKLGLIKKNTEGQQECFGCGS